MGVLGAAAALIVYLIATLPQARRVVAWKEDIRVLQFSSYHNLTLANAGDGPIFLSHIAIEGDVTHPIVKSGKDRFTQTWIANVEIAAGNIAVKPYSDQNVIEAVKLYRVVSGLDDVAWGRALKAADLAELVISGGSCFIYVVLWNSDPFLLQLRDHLGSSLRTFPAKATLHYFSAGVKRMEALEFPVVGILARKPTRECQRAGQ